MEPKPVERHPAPHYPTRRDILLGAAGFVLIELVGCGEAESADPAKPAAGRTIVAPIFKHGEGRGATGCIVIAPPVFLSEEEAVQIIREELAKHGVKLGGPIVLTDVRMTIRLGSFELDEKDGKRELKLRVKEAPGLATKPLRLNAVDGTKRVAVLFVSEKAYSDLGGPLNASTVQEYDFPEVSEYVAAHLKKQSRANLCIGILYDPAVRVNYFGKGRPKGQSFAETEMGAKAKSFELLRQQADDFAAWLKQRKVL